jgi:hypothetical protein
MESAEATRWLIILLDERPSLALTTMDLEHGFRVGSLRYDDIGGSALTACYDRLLSPLRHFVGIRFWPVDTLEVEMPNWLPTRPYVVADVEGEFVDIFFTGAPTAAESTGDQAFGGQVFRTFTGKVAISIDIDYLTQSGEDLVDLHTLDVAWFTPE